jgi:predicted ester cyclase
LPIIYFTFSLHTSIFEPQLVGMTDNKAIIQAFLVNIRGGNNLQDVALYMADTILAHQMNVENPTTVTRTPSNYADNIREFLTMFGNFTLEITELLADGDKVYARWLQKGHHLTTIDVHAATGKPLNEIASCVYRLEAGKIVEYWIQIDRYVFEWQLTH